MSLLRFSSRLFGLGALLACTLRVNAAAAADWAQNGPALARADGASNDAFGISLGFSGDTLIAGAAIKTVGANSAQGAAYVFVRTGASFTRQAALIAADGAAGDNFGVASAVSADTVVVGANAKKISGQSAQGAAYVFLRSGTKWAAQGAALTASDGKAADQFGSAVAISGDTVVLGAPTKAIGSNATQGAAYVFVRSGVTWSQQAELTAADGAATDRFGGSVSISGDTVVIGASYKKRGQNVKQGAAYVFVRSGTKWGQQGTLLTASDGTANDQFGDAVAVDTNTIAIGAFNKNVGVNAVQGAVYIFVRSGTAWARQGGVLRPTDAIANNGFGASLALFGNTLVVGAPANSPSASLQNQGAGYVFLRTGTAWAQTGGALLPSDATTADEVGYAVAGAGDFVALGAPMKSVSGHDTQGATYLFTRPCTSVSDCAASATCTNHLCAPKQAQGQTCKVTSDCTAGSCVDGVCCESACTGQCQACAEKGSEGKCVTVAGVPRSGRAACAGVGTACAGSCDGATPNQCSYPGASVSCGQSCASGTETKSLCNGAGTCTNQAQSCGDYTCAANACKTSCAGDADCAAGKHCVASACKTVLASGGAGGTQGGASGAGGSGDASSGGMSSAGTSSGGMSSGGMSSGGMSSGGADSESGGRDGSAGANEPGAGGMIDVGGTGGSGAEAGSPALSSGGTHGEAGQMNAEAGEAGAHSAANANADGGGCGCRLERAPRPPNALLALLPLALFTLRRRRRNVTSVA